MGVALSVCTLPGQVTPDRLGSGKMELGLGIRLLLLKNRKARRAKRSSPTIIESLALHLCLPQKWPELQLCLRSSPASAGSTETQRPISKPAVSILT